MDSTNKDNELNNILKSLQKIDNHEQLDTIKKSLIELYQGGYRHSYSAISSFIFKANQSNREELHETLSQIIDYLDPIVKSLKELYYKKQIGEDVYYGVYKLFDHINLELIRVSYINLNLNETSSKFNEHEIFITKIDQRYKDIKEKINLFEQQFAEESKTQRNQNITILGIFASIVITIFADISISSAVISSISEAPAYKLAFFSCLTGFITLNILLSMLFFLSIINKVKWQPFFKIFVCACNIILILTMLLIACYYCIYLYPDMGASFLNLS